MDRFGEIPVKFSQAKLKDKVLPQPGGPVIKSGMGILAHNTMQ